MTSPEPDVRSSRPRPHDGSCRPGDAPVSRIVDLYFAPGVSGLVRQVNPEKRDQAVVDEHNEQGGMPVRTSYNPFYANCDNLGTCYDGKIYNNISFSVF